MGAAIADADAEIRVRRAEAEIEQQGFTVFGAQRLGVGAKFGQHASAVHRAVACRKAQRNLLIPA